MASALEWRMGSESQYTRVTLKSQRAIKWPRYEVQVGRGLRYRDAFAAACDLLRTHCGYGTPLMLARFKYDAVSGIVDTRVDATGYCRDRS